MIYELTFTKDAIKDRLFWKKSRNKSILDKIEKLLEDIEKNPKNGLGKPKPLKHESGLWSRRMCVQ